MRCLRVNGISEMKYIISVDPAIKGKDYTVEYWEFWDKKSNTVSISLNKGKTWHLISPTKGEPNGRTTHDR